MERLEYVYDGRDRLRRVKRYVANALTGSEEYWYDANGARIASVKRDNTNLKTEMIWVIGDTEAHYDPAGVVTHVYSNVTLGTPVARVHRTADSVASIEYQFHGLGNGMLASVASNGAIVSGFRYTPWGDVIDAIGTPTDLGEQRRRFNDKYVDVLSGLSYYGARYFDKVSLTWTQSDKLFTKLPDSRKSSPRMALLYGFSMQNPMRYIDPDGNSAQDMVNSIATPSRAEIIGAWATHQKLGQAASKGNAAAKQSAERASVMLIYGMLKGDLGGTHVRVADIESDGYDGYYSFWSDTITIDGSLVNNAGGDFDTFLWLTLSAAHEIIHREQYHSLDIFFVWARESDAYEGQREIARKWFAAGTITQDEFNTLMAKIQASELAASPSCKACAAIPEMFQVEDRFRKRYIEGSRHFFQGLWGLERNPKGPSRSSSATPIR